MAIVFYSSCAVGLMYCVPNLTHVAEHLTVTNWQPQPCARSGKCVNADAVYVSVRMSKG